MTGTDMCRTYQQRTSQWLGITNFDYNISPKEQNGEHLGQLTKSEFRRLTDQVRDARFNKHSYHGNGFKKVLLQPDGGIIHQVYRSQLAASIRAFQPKIWRPLNQDDSTVTLIRCRPISGHSIKSGWKSPAKRSRPESAPARTYHPPRDAIRPRTADINPGRYDTLDPDVMKSLLRRQQVSETYQTVSSMDKPDAREDDTISTSGIGSTKSDDDNSLTGDDTTSRSSDQNTASRVIVRPEELDAIYLPDEKRDRRRFDFDVVNVDYPTYDFKNPLPEPFSSFDLQFIALNNINWKDFSETMPAEPFAEEILDRLINIEALQGFTEEWEGKRNKPNRVKNANRFMNAKFQDKRCCGSCRQPTCAGDCPEKRVNCERCINCRQVFCTGTCKDTTYNQRANFAGVEVTDKRAANPRPRSCGPCQRRNNAKVLNANGVLLGRPKSSRFTFSRGQNATKGKVQKPSTETSVSGDICKDLEELGIELPNDPDAEDESSAQPSTTKSIRHRSRNGLCPGKSYFSQRKDSLTRPASAEAEHVNRKKKTKPTKLKRPQTAL